LRTSHVSNVMAFGPCASYGSARQNTVFLCVILNNSNI
jgi:hypothetical protein